MKDVYKLRSRYGEIHTLKRIKDNEYEFHSPDPYYRVIFEEGSTNADIHAVDPSGGPFMDKGFQLEENVVIDEFITQEKGPIIFKLKEV